MSGDSLDDDFVVSDNDDTLATELVSEQQDIQGETSDPEAEASNKAQQQEPSPNVKRRKLNKKENETPDEDEPVPYSIFPPWVLAEQFAEKQAKTFPGLSRLEYEEIRLDDKCVLDLSQWKPPKPEDRFSLVSLLHEIPFPDPLPEGKGSPYIIVLSGAALRVADLCRAVKSTLPHRTKAGKLFARHVKLEEHVRIVSSTVMPIAIGTPGRLAQLLQHPKGPLRLDNLRYVVLDVSYRDPKGYHIWDMHGIQHDLFSGVLGNTDIVARLRAGDTKLVFL